MRDGSRAFVYVHRQLTAACADDDATIGLTIPIRVTPSKHGPPLTVIHRFHVGVLSFVRSRKELPLHCNEYVFGRLRRGNQWCA